MIYLCGGINGLSDADCRDWREVAKTLLLPASTLDPMRRDYRGIEDQSVDAIVKGDLEDIALARAILVSIDRPSWGTAMEIVYAHQQSKLIVGWGAPARVSPWLRYHCHHISPTLQDACAYIEHTQSL